MSRNIDKSLYRDMLEDLETDDVCWIECPLEPNGKDKVCSCEVNYTTGQFYCHNCHRFGTTAELHQLQQNKFLL